MNKLLTTEQLRILNKTRNMTAIKKTYHFTPEEITIIRHSYWITGLSYQNLATTFKTSKTTISAIVHGKTYKHVPFPEEWFKVEPTSDPVGRDSD